MALTPEQIEAARKKYNITPSGGTLTPEQVQAARLKYGVVQPAPEKEGFLKTLGREIATPFGQVAVAGRNLIGGVSQLAQGNVAEAGRELSSSRQLPFLGETQPFVTGKESTPQAFKKIAGTGADIASNFIAGGAIKNLATLPLRTAVKASAIQGFKEGSVAGGLALGGKAAREDKKADEVIGDAILGILAGGVGGAVLGGAFTGAKRGLAPVARGASKIGQTVSDKAGKVVEKQVSRFAEQYPKQVARLKVYRGQAQATPELIKQELADLTKTLVDIAQEREGTRKALDKVMRERGFNPLEEVGIQGLVPEFDFSKGRATLDYSLGRDRLKKLIGDGVDVVTREMERLDELGQNVAGRTGETINQFAKRVTNNLKKSDLTAGDEKSLVNKVKKELDAIQEKYGNRLSLSQINDFRRQYNRGYSGEDRLLPDLDYAFASAAREAIDDLAQSDIVRRINGQIGRWIEAERFIGRYLDGKNVGSGRFGLWLGRLIGSNIGNNEISRLIGTLGGDQVVKLIQRLQFSSPIRRKILEGLAQDEALLKELLETSSERSRNYILEQVKKAPRLLPESPQGTPQQQNFVPIRLPERTQSTIDAASQRNISRSTTIPQNTPNAATNQPATASIAQTNNPPTTNLRNVSIPKAVSQATQSVKQDSVGAAAGFSLDEEGNPTFDKEMALAGVLGAGALKRVGSKPTVKTTLPYKETGNLTTKILKDLEGKTTVSKQYILDATNRGELKQVERDLIRQVLDDMDSGNEKMYITSNIETLNKNGVKVSSPNDVITLYHGTNQKGLKGISGSNFLNEGTYLATNKKVAEMFSFGKGGVVEVKVPVKDLGKVFSGTMAGKDGVSIQTFSKLIKGSDGVYRKSSDTINVSDFAKKVKAELLPLEIMSKKADVGYGHKLGTRYENIALPDEVRGKVANYDEHIYQSPIKTSAGNVHFGDLPDKYFGHTRIEDMADNQTRRVIEVQSDLYQKGNLEKEVDDNFTVALRKLGLEDEHDTLLGDIGIKNLNPEQKNRIRDIQKQVEDVIGSRKSEVAKLQQYNDPTAHFRMIREEIKKASQDGKTKLQFPTGETAMKIEQLGETSNFFSASNKPGMEGMFDVKLKPESLKIGEEIFGNGDQWIITDVLGDGKFKAVPKQRVDFDKYAKETTPGGLSVDVGGKRGYFFESAIEQFDISGKVDTNNPIYKFYEKDLGKYLKKFGAELVTDSNGVQWYEVPIKKEYGKMPVEAFGLVPFAGFPMSNEE